MVKVTLAKVRNKGQHYWDKLGTEYVCSGGAVDYSVDGTMYWINIMTEQELDKICESQRGCSNCQKCPIFAEYLRTQED